MIHAFSKFDKDSRPQPSAKMHKAGQVRPTSNSNWRSFSTEKCGEPFFAASNNASYRPGCITSCSPAAAAQRWKRLQRTGSPGAAGSRSHGQAGTCQLPEMLQHIRNVPTYGHHSGWAWDGEPGRPTPTPWAWNIVAQEDKITIILLVCELVQQTWCVFSVLSL